ncbi:MAG: hypothetical protein EPO32_02725 [Anaerolineae bacterium]|nr:MAG: hypothetical protein EPO32_02725 [Anaerolineae bacterium]
MRPVNAWTTVLHLIILPFALFFQQERTAAILTPVHGEALQGLVAIEGNASGDGFSGFDLEFAIEGDSNQTWFLVARGNQPVMEGLLGEWDTSNLTDGQYHLRLRVTYSDGTLLENTVEQVRVRNFTPIETDTPVPTDMPQPGQLPTSTSTLMPPTVTPFPPNPAEMPAPAVSRAVYAGVGSAILLLAGLAVYVSRKRRL